MASSLSDVKNSLPVHLAQYALNNGLEHYLAFSWRVNKTLKRRKAFIEAIQSTYLQMMHN